MELICGLFGPAELLDLGGRERSAAHYGPDELLVLGLAGVWPADACYPRTAGWT